jgi:hypothetical protein
VHVQPWLSALDRGSPPGRGDGSTKQVVWRSYRRFFLPCQLITSLCFL